MGNNASLTECGGCGRRSPTQDGGTSDALFKVLSAGANEHVFAVGGGDVWTPPRPRDLVNGGREEVEDPITAAFTPTVVAAFQAGGGEEQEEERMSGEAGARTRKLFAATAAEAAGVAEAPVVDASDEEDAFDDEVEYHHQRSMSAEEHTRAVVGSFRTKSKDRRNSKMKKSFRTATMPVGAPLSRCYASADVVSSEAGKSAYTRTVRPSPMALSSAKLRKLERLTGFNHVSPLHAEASNKEAQAGDTAAAEIIAVTATGAADAADA